MLPASQGERLAFAYSGRLTVTLPAVWRGFNKVVQAQRIATNPEVKLSRAKVGLGPIGHQQDPVLRPCKPFKPDPHAGGQFPIGSFRVIRDVDVILRRRINASEIESAANLAWDPLRAVHGEIGKRAIIGIGG